MVTVEDFTAEDEYLGPVLAAGRQLSSREPGHILLGIPARDMHVHLYQQGDPAVEDYLLRAINARAGR